MNIKLIALTKNDPAEFAGAKRLISDCANAFNQETEKFKNFSSPKRALLATSQALRSADAVIVAVQASGFNSVKKMLLSALGITPQINDEVYAQLLPLYEKGKISKGVLINHSTFSDSAEVFVTDDFLHCGFSVSAGSQCIIVLPLDNIKTAQTVFGGVYTYLSDLSGAENKIDIPKFARFCLAKRAIEALMADKKTLSFAPLNGTVLFKEAFDNADVDGSAVSIGSPPLNRQPNQQIEQYITDVAQKCREASSTDYALAVSSAFASNSDDSVFVVIAFADKNETKIVRLHAVDGEKPKDFVDFAIQKAIEIAGSCVLEKSASTSKTKADKADRLLRQKISTVAAFAIGGSAAICAILALILGQ